MNFCGVQVKKEDLVLIREIVRDCDGLSRTELAHTVCELLDWRRANGRLKAHECRQFLEGLEAKGLLQLPGMKESSCKPRAKAAILKDAPDFVHEPLTGSLSELGPVKLELLETQEDGRQWRGWVEQYHYLGCKVAFGASLRYFVKLDGHKPQRVGCIQLSSPAWKIAQRDQWIGWDAAQRVRGLQQIIQNSRFLILPWVKVTNLASAALACMARTVGPDWEASYAVRPLLLETLVDPARYKGTCYKAANWIHLGLTSGRGRMDEGKRNGLRPKEVFIYPLHRKAREKLLES